MKMELIAALLHSPEVLFLDEPTIGLDVVAQHNIQQFLKYYQQKRQITILLTSHYMKDVSALCKRVVIIADGRLHYDGSLSGIVDRFSGYKVVTLQLAEGQEFGQLDRFGIGAGDRTAQGAAAGRAPAGAGGDGRDPRRVRGRRRGGGGSAAGGGDCRDVFARRMTRPAERSGAGQAVLP